MSDEQKLIEVTSRAFGEVIYTIKEKNIYRSFAQGEKKNIPLDELQSLQWEPGGEYILKNLLVINDKPALDSLNMEVEPEYFYDEAKVREFLPSCSLDELEDCLNFAPEGVLELIKQIAVETELPDTRKREMISKKLGFSIDSAIIVNHTMNEEEDDKKEEEQTTKRKAVAPTTTATGRKAATPSYTIKK